ncbi:MAG: heme ABC transporter permease CcmC [Gammaproteobacteria bacterium]|nr:heme ABC transporter permease CcmC [Gammaproteobacteria bacterium]
MTLKTFWHQLGSPRWFYQMSKPWLYVFGCLAFVLLLTGTVWGLGFAPMDGKQGNSFRIIYVHVPTAMVAQSAYILMGVAGLVLLVWRMKLADMVLAAVVPFGMSMTVLALVTGTLWGKPTWIAEGDDTWWVWDARTASMLVLLFLYFGLYALRQAIPRQEAAGRACAVLAIVGMINIPIIKYSVDWWLTLHQTSSISLTQAPTMPAEMWLPLVLNIVGIYCLLGANVLSRLRLEILRREQGTQWVRELALSGNA